MVYFYFHFHLARSKSSKRQQLQQSHSLAFIWNKKKDQTYLLNKYILVIGCFAVKGDVVVFSSSKVKNTLNLLQLHVTGGGLPPCCLHVCSQHLNVATMERLVTYIQDKFADRRFILNKQPLHESCHSWH